MVPPLPTSASRPAHLAVSAIGHTIHIPLLYSRATPCLLSSPARIGVHLTANGSRSLWTSRRAANASHTTTHLVQGAALQAQAQALSPQPSAPPPQAPLPAPPKKRSFFRKLKIGSYLFLFTSFGAFSYYVWDCNHPPDQLPHDPSKKTIVVLGSGWGATSLLKSIDTEAYNVHVISPHSHFLFTPLLPSATVSTVQPTSIAQPTRHTTRYKKRHVAVIEAEATKVDLAKKTVEFEHKSDFVAQNLGSVSISYDYLIYATGNQPTTFGIKNVEKYGCFLKELSDAPKIRERLLDCVETASLTGQSSDEIDRLLHMVVVGGGATGVEYAAELRDFVQGDLTVWYPEVAKKIRVTLIEAMPSILPMFSSKLIEYTLNTFKQSDINVLTRHMVKDVDDTKIHVKAPTGEDMEIPYGMLVWAAGNTARPLTKDMQSQLGDKQTDRRGLSVDDHMRLVGAEDSVFAIGDATATKYAPTAQSASQQGSYIGRVLNQLARVEELETQLETIKSSSTVSAEEVAKETERITKQLAKASRIRPFHYTHQGSLAYIGRHSAIADLPMGNGGVAVAGKTAHLFWRSAYFTMLFGLRNRMQVGLDWFKVWLFGRDLSRE